MGRAFELQLASRSHLGMPSPGDCVQYMQSPGDGAPTVQNQQKHNTLHVRVVTTTALAATPGNYKGAGLCV